MNKREYLEKLNYEIGNMSAEQRDEIISIFNEHFEQGMLDGKSEEDICQDLGSPAFVAAQFIENNREVLQNSKANTPADALPHTPNTRQDPSYDGRSESRPTSPQRQTNEHPSRDGNTYYTGEVNISKSFNSTEVSKINVNMRAADIKIHSVGSDGNIRVTLNGHSKNSRFEVDVTNGVLNIIENRKFVLINLLSFGGSVRVEIFVPQSFNGGLYLKNSAGNVSLNGLSLSSARLHSTAGDVKVTGHTGELELNSTAGNALINNVRGNMDVLSSAGDIRIEECSGDITAHTTAGNIKISNNKGRISATTSAGDVTVKATEIYALTASSSAGNIKAETEKITGDVDISSSMGNVVLETRVIAASISAKSSLGNVTIALPRDASMRISSKSSGKVKSEIISNPDSPHILDISTSLGTVNIKSLN